MWLVQSAHLAVIDALMAMGAMETVAAVKACGSAERLGGASSWEDAVLHWVNGVRTKAEKQWSLSVSLKSYFSIFSRNYDVELQFFSQILSDQLIE